MHTKFHLSPKIMFIMFLGLNSANSNYFCRYCYCTKEEINKITGTLYSMYISRAHNAIFNNGIVQNISIQILTLYIYI